MPSLAQKWMDQGMQKGMLEDAREMVIDALDTRFGTYPSYFKDRIVQISDRDKLKQIFRVILKTESIEELEKAKVWN